MTPEEKRVPETANRIADENPGYSRCHKCGLPWNHCQPKSLRFNDQGGGFAMCTYCWKHSTTEEKIHHYKSLFYEWARWGFHDYSLKQIEDAVMKELEEEEKDRLWELNKTERGAGDDYPIINLNE